MPTEPFLAELSLVPFDFAPKGWAPCNGQFLPINQNQALFALLGTTYGGNGQTTFALPDLRGRVPMHMLGNTIPLGARFGEEAHTISVAEMPQHIHLRNGTTNAATANVPTGLLPAVTDNTTFGPIYADPTSLVPMAAQAVGSTGGSQAHENRQPYLALQWIIALQGIFPSRN